MHKHIDHILDNIQHPLIILTTPIFTYTDLSQPSFVSFAFMKYRITLAVVTPACVVIVLLITAIIITFIVARNVRKIADKKFQEKIVKENAEVVKILSDKVPVDSYPQFLEFAEKILLMSCDACKCSQRKVQRNHVIPEGGIEDAKMEEAQDEGEDEYDGEEDDHPLLGTMVRTVESVLKNKRIGKSLRQRIANMISPGEEAFHDQGYSGSNSGSNSTDN